MINRNENRPGYKKTKIGWIPGDWNISRLDSISSVKTGPFGAQLHQSDYVKIGTPIITVEHLSEQGIIHKNLPCVSDEDKNRLAKYQLNDGDIVFSRVGSVDRNSIISKNESGWLFSGRLLRIRPNTKILFSSFLSYFLNQGHIKHFIRSIAVGGTMPSLNTTLLSSVSVPLPTYYEQKEIAEILFSWDKAINQTRKLIEAKKLLKKGLMQQLLIGKKRLKGFKKSKERIDFKFFDLPDDWKCFHIRKIAKECFERNTNRDDLTVLACSKYLGFVESSEYFGKRVFSEDTSNYKIIRRNCFGFPANHIEEGSIGLLTSHDMGLVSPIYTVFKFNNKIVPEYIYAVFKTETFRHIFAISTNASVDRRGNLRWREFSLIRVPLPSLKEQQRMVDVLQSAENEIRKLEAKLKALEKQKRGLMQKLLSGEIRVKT